MSDLPTEQQPALILCGDARTATAHLPPSCVHTSCSSPPYFNQRDYEIAGQIGLEPTVEGYVQSILDVTDEVYRLLRPDGTFWLNLGDKFANDGKWGGRTSGKHVAGLHGQTATGRRRVQTGFAPKELIGIPWRVCFAMQEQGWILRSAITLCKLSPMSESVADRPTQATEMLFMFVKNPEYYYDTYAARRWSDDPAQGHLQTKLAHQVGDKINGDGNLWTYWPFRSANTSAQHYAAYHPDLPARCIDLGTSAKGYCPTCGEPWVRVFDKKRIPTRPGKNTKIDYQELKDKADQLLYGNRDSQRHMTEVTHQGWRSTCAHDATPPTSAIVYDPFSGSGTTGVVAIQKGCRYLGVELNPAHVEATYRRLAEPLGIGGLFALPTADSADNR